MSATIAPAQPDQRQESSTLRSVFLAGPAGRLEAVVNEGAPDAPFAALVCHPHPLGGGNLHNKVVYHAMKALNDPQWGLGLPVLRFNFRGTGLSEGTHHGQAESADVLAALAWLENEYKRPVVAVGFSFGAAMTVLACCGHGKSSANLRALVALGLPTWTKNQSFSYPFLRACSLPKFFLSGDQDQFAPAAQLVQVADLAADPKRLVLLPGADHFFTGHLAAMQSSLAGWLKEQLS
ncbi:MAG TPA: alpha/beta family hydrolase [Terracidiphilus sp.]|nr:alpha/beta family hydrolase [Terracidiphilus sp.]